MKADSFAIRELGQKNVHMDDHYNIYLNSRHIEINQIVALLQVKCLALKIIVSFLANDIEDRFQIFLIDRPIFYHANLLPVMFNLKQVIYGFLGKKPGPRF